MGVLIYGNGDSNGGDSVQIPDRILEHVRVLFSAKLRRGESFPFSWRNVGEGTGRSTIWVHASIPIRFNFDNDVPCEIDGELLQELAQRANSTAGLAIDLNEWDAAPLAEPRDITPRRGLERAA